MSKKDYKVNMSRYGVNQWKPPWIMYIIMFLAGIYFSLRFASGWNNEQNVILVISQIIQDMASHPFSISIIRVMANFRVFAVTLILLWMAVLLYMIFDLGKERKFKPGREHGTGKWTTPESINSKFEDKEHPGYNRIYSQNIRVSMEKKTGINNNVIVVGGSGVGKSAFLLTPNLYQADTDSRFPGSFVITDPKGELLSKNAKLLKEKGYVIRTLNLVPGMLGESDCFNMMEYIRDSTDIKSLIQNLIDNTDCGEKPPDPFWPKAEAMFLNALMLAVWMEHDLMGWENSFNTVIDLVSEAQLDDKGNCTLDVIFRDIVAKTHGIKGKGIKHPAYKKYKDAMSGAADTKRSILVTTKARLDVFDDEHIRRIMSKDELNLASLGTGMVDGKENVRTALFVITPDYDTTYNALAGMMYTLIFKELCFQADFACKPKWKGELPVPVTFWLDEFKNIVLPPNFLKLLSTIRSRYMSAVIFVQNITQLKELYDEAWEEVPGNCDTFVYLGGNEYASFEYVSKLLGCETFYKKSQSESFGGGSSSRTTDVMGGELLRPEQVRMLENDKCVVLIRGTDPCIDYKYKTFETSEFKHSSELGEYFHSAMKNETLISFATPEEKSRALVTGNFLTIDLDESDFVSPEAWYLYQIAVQNSEEERKERERKKVVDINEISLFELLERKDFILPMDQYEEVIKGLNDGLTEDQVKSYILYNDAERMKRARLLYTTINKKSKIGGDMQYADE